MNCMYCDFVSTGSEMFIVQRAVKPKGRPHRWQRIGYCCEKCEAAGRPVRIEYEQQDAKPD